MGVTILNPNANTYWGAGTAYYGAATSHIVAEEVRRNGSLIAAIATAAVGLATAINYSNKYREILEWRNEINDKLLAVTRCFNDIWCDITYPQLLKSVQDSIAIPDLELDCDAELAFLKNCSDELAGQSESMINQIEAQYCNTPSGCNTSKSRFSSLGLVNAIAARMQSVRRRIERRREMKATVINSAHAGTLRNTSPATQPLGTALSLSSTLASQTSAQANSGFNTFGQGAGSIINTLGG